MIFQFEGQNGPGELVNVVSRNNSPVSRDDFFPVAGILPSLLTRATVSIHAEVEGNEYVARPGPR
jgi:hypothetical protein